MNKNFFRSVVAYRGIGPRISARDQISFVKQLSTLSGAHVPLIESLQMIRDQYRAHALSIILDTIIADVQNGKSLSKSLSRHPAVFGDFALSVVAIGEASGTLPYSLGYLAQELHKRRLLRRAVAGALLYPALIAAATLLLSVFLMAYLFPKLMPIFLSLHTQLPLSTRVVIGVSEFLRHYGLLLAFLSLLLLAAWWLARRRYMIFRRASAAAAMRAPFLKTLIRGYNMAEALDHGEEVSKRLRAREDLFPRSAAHMIAAGERSGEMAESFMYVAKAHESEFEEYTKSFSTLLEPALMIVMGLFVGTVAISIITPIYGLTEQLHS